MTKALDLLQSITEKALKAGAEAADAVYAESTSMSTSCRMGKLEDVERSEGADLGLRVLIGKRQANVSTTDLSADTLDMMIERAVAMAQIAPEDPFCGLAPRERLLSSIPDLDLDDGSDPSAASLGERAEQAEAAGLEVSGITNSGGAGASFGRGGVTLVTSHGFAGHYTGTSHSVSVSLLAGEGTAMERDYDYSSTRHLSELSDAAKVGRNAGERTMRRLNPRKVPSQSANVIYDPRVSGGLVGHFAGAISGSSVARGTSFLKEKMGEAIFASGVQIIDDPLRKRGLRSKPFDGEGVENGLLKLVADGALQCWLLDCATARQLKLESNGRASRGIGGPPAPSTTNLYMEAGSRARDDLIKDLGTGLYITEMIGMGVNGITGDYSRGASGFWVENGELTFPVSEITVASNLKDMFMNMTVADDLEFHYGTNAPTVLVEGMTIAGS